MEVTLSDLQLTYSAKADAELLELHARGTLTDVAYEAIEAELASRKIAIPPRPAPDAEHRVAERHRDEQLRGLGGWLILVGIGVVLSPIRLLGMLATLYLPVFTNGTWQALTDSDSEAYHPLWGTIIVGELVFNVAMAVASAYLLFLFFSKSYLFPRAYIALAFATLVFVPLDAWVVTFVLPEEPMFDEDTAREFGRALVGSLIWIPYVLNSRRVKATFVEGRHLAIMASRS